MSRYTYIIITILTLLTSCYGEPPKGNVSAVDSTLTQQQLDSISFFSKRHYTEGFNFVVYEDSITLLMQQPEELVSQFEIDTFDVFKDHEIVVGDFRIIPQDSIDSVWVQVATDEGAFGWIHESDLLKGVVPVDPISRFIMYFSDSHILIALVMLFLIGMVYTMRLINKRNIPIVHLRDIPTFYPTLLCLIVATSATFYASLQLFAAESWQNFYFHPTLNPLKVPLILSIFISSVWLMLIVVLATIDETLRQLRFVDAVIYLCGLCCVCAVLYVIFSISTLYYVGYPLLVAYYYYALRQYFKSRNRYICGHCGHHMRNAGKCPKCGTNNVMFLLAALLLVSCDPETHIKPEVKTLANRTVIVYASAENNLDSSSPTSYSYFLNDLNEMKAGARNLTDAQNLIVFYDCRDKYSVVDGNPQLAKSGKPRIVKFNAYGENLVKEFDTDFSSVDPDRMSEVFRYIVNEFPSESYGLVFWGHGAGMLSRTDTAAVRVKSVPQKRVYGADEGYDANVNGAVWINTPTLARVIEKSLPHLDFLMFDCCNMITVENAYELRRTTDYLVGSPCEIPGEGAPYNHVVPDFFLAKEKVGQAICDDYINHTMFSSAYSGLPLTVVKTENLEALRYATMQVMPDLGNRTDQIDTDSCVYYFKMNSLSLNEIMYDMRHVMYKNLSAEDFRYWDEAFQATVTYAIRPVDYREKQGCSYDWITDNSSTGPNINFTKFHIRPESYGGMSMFFPKRTYDYVHYPLVSPNKSYYDYLWAY